MMRTAARAFVRVLLPIAVIGVTAWVVRMLYLTRPTATKQEVDPPVPTVSVIDLQPADHRVTIEAFGTVVPARQVTLQAQISGRIIEQHPSLVPGGVLTEGSEVLKIDPTDYELRVKQEEVALESAKASFELERGQQVVAAKEWELLKDEIEAPQDMADFALRKPQQRVAQANVEAASNRLALARLDLERTSLAAPFNALVLNESVELGQLISPQTAVATLVGTDLFWVQVSVPIDRLSRIHFADESGQGGSPAEILAEQSTTAPRQGRALRLLGDLSDRGRMARILVGVDDPLGLSSGKDRSSPVLLNSYVRVVIGAGMLHDVYEIPRVALRENQRVWVRDADGRLQIRRVDVRWRMENSVLATDGFEPGDQLIVSRLAEIVPGMPVRVGRLPGTATTTAPASTDLNGDRHRDS